MPLCTSVCVFLCLYSQANYNISVHIENKRDKKSRVRNDGKYALHLANFIVGIAQFLLSFGRGENKIKTRVFFDTAFV